MLFKRALKDDLPQADLLEDKLSILAEQLQRVIDSINTLCDREQEAMEQPVDQTDTIPPGSAKAGAKRLRDAAEMGDVTELLTIADSLKSESDGFLPYSRKIMRLADDFDFEGIMHLADELDKLTET